MRRLILAGILGTALTAHGQSKEDMWYAQEMAGESAAAAQRQAAAAQQQAEAAQQQTRALQQQIQQQTIEQLAQQRAQQFQADRAAHPESDEYELLPQEPAHQLPITAEEAGKFNDGIDHAGNRAIAEELYKTQQMLLSPPETLQHAIWRRACEIDAPRLQAGPAGTPCTIATTTRRDKATRTRRAVKNRIT